MRGYKRGFILIVLLGMLLLALSGSSTMVQKVSASTTYNILYMVGNVGSTSLSASAGATEYSNVFDTSGESITWSKGDWASNWWAGVDTTSWSVGVDCSKTGGSPNIAVAISLTGKTTLTQQLTTCGGTRSVQFTSPYDTSGWSDHGATTTWLNDGSGSRVLSVTITWTSGTVTVYWGNGTATSRMNTGTIVPENLLFLVLLAPLIPLFSKSLAKRGRAKKT